MFQNTSIIDKTYKKLAIQVSLNGLSFATFDTLLNKPLTLQKIEMGNVSITSKIEDLFANAFQNHPELKAGYDEIIIIHSNNLSTFVPTALFDEDYLGSYLQFNTKVFETDSLYSSAGTNPIFLNRFFSISGPFMASIMAFKAKSVSNPCMPLA